MKVTATVYLLRGGERKTGYWFLPMYFNYKKNALAFSRKMNDQVTVVKFTSEKMK